MNKLKLLAALLAAFFSISSYGQVYRFQGTVRDSADQKTIENVVVEAIPVSATDKGSFTVVTDIKGRFTIDLPSANYRVVLKLLGYNISSHEVNIKGDLQQDFILSSQDIPLGEIEVSSLRINRQVKELPIPLAVVSSNRYQKLSSMTLSNVLAAEPGVAMGSDGVWATNVNIRGLGESRLVTLIDGNRVETATDLTASLSMVDVNDIERVEVIKGAQSSLYGTGAMGGIVNIITKDGHFSGKPYISGNVTSGFASANDLITEHADINTGSDRWYLRVSGTYSDADDIRTPEGTLPNSQFTTNNVTAKFGFKPSANHLLKIQYQNNWSKNVGIPGGEAFPGPAEATYTDISRQLISASYEISNITDRLSSLKLSYFNQYIQRDVAMIPNTVTETPIAAGIQRITPQLVSPIGDHMTNGAQLQSTWNFADNNTLIAGVDVWSRNLKTERTKIILNEVINNAGTVVKTNNIVRGETPIPESSFGSAGVFLQDEAHLLNDKLTLIIGGRLDGIHVENEQSYDVDYLIVNGVRNDSPANQRITFEKGSENDMSWSANTGMLYKLDKNIDLSLNLARSFRSPSLEERFKYIDLGNYVRLGDPNLDPESGYSADLGLRVWKPKFSFQIDGFVNRISNMIVESPGEFVYTLNTGVDQGTTDTIPAYINSNVSKALLYGLDFSLQYNVYSDLVLFGSGSFVRGRDTEADEDLPQIPPLSGRLGLRYICQGIGSAEVAVAGAARQDKIAEGEKETGGYARLDLALSSARINVGPTKLQLFAGIDNITDRSYTNHLSTNRGSISIEPGRNIYLRLSLSF
ncbi:MAG TPA: TonB-dependent receptor [Bacteroidales bacterium]|nr:TonB-dependent receptor [Bacteroidales bacterium]